MSKLIIMVGLPGSGKSTIAKDIKDNYLKFLGNDEVKIFSSDEYRKIMFNNEEDQTHNAEVFNKLNLDLENFLISNNNVAIFDATNITLKSSIKALDIEDYKVLLDNYYSTKDAISTCNHIIKKAEEERLVADIKVNNYFIYNHCPYDLKDEWIGGKRGVQVKIISITDKTVTYEQICNYTERRRVNKEAFEAFVISGKLVFIGDAARLESTAIITE